MFCIDCGKPAEIDVRCRDCYRKRIDRDLFKYKFQICPSCEKVKVGTEWKENHRAIDRYIEDRLRRYFDDARVDSEERIVILTKQNIDFEFTLDIEFEERLCPTCSRISGGYYEGEIQLRGKYTKGLLKAITSMFDRIENPYSVKNLKEGTDIRFFSSKKALETVRELGLKYRLSRKLHTQIQGKRKYRLTILIRDDDNNN
ncbi:MAG: 60S ribosomal export protein NMD3 [Candidatus Micrarchaeota archaeon]|nr:60S ribosomal export protein NMD3 [Candidatus Micrarchaeota archaeon]MCX8154549.1 60S ribosomal export protein NMD3 [Candidatus Micrarchaeota archaeon]